MSKLFTAMGAVLAFSACADVHETNEPAPGIYELRIDAELDACSPVRPVGAMGPVAVLVEAGAIDAPVPDAPLPLLISPRVRLAPEAAFHAETNRRLPGCEGAWVHEEWTMLDASRAGFEILHHQLWHGLASCADASASMPGAPEADCQSERSLRYGLEEACAAPCALRLTSTTSVVCACD